MHKRIQKCKDQISTIEQIEQQLLQVNGFTPSAIISVAGNKGGGGTDHHHQHPHVSNSHLTYQKKPSGAADKSSLSINTSNSQNATITHNGGASSIRKVVLGHTNAIQGRRVDSPELKMAVNREFIMAEQGRPHTSGMPFINGGIIYRHQYEVKEPMSSQTASLRTRQTHHDDGTRSGRQQYIGRASKSQHPNQKRKKNQTSRSTPKGYTSIVNTNIQAQIVNTTAQQIFNINIHNAKPASATEKGPASAGAQQYASSSVPQTTTNSQQLCNAMQRKRADTNKFHSHGGQSIVSVPSNSGVMSAPNKSKSRSRSLRRRHESQGPRAAAVSTSISQHSKASGPAGSRPPRQPQNLLNRSSINYTQKNTTLDITGAGGPVDAGFSFEHQKENDESININEFSPSRITKAQGQKINRVNGFLDSDSSLSSPKPQNNNHNLLHALEAASSGPQTGKSHYMDKSAFMKHFSPDRESTDMYVGGQALSSSGHHSREISGSQKLGAGGQLDSKALAAAHHRVNLSIVDKMMKERFKEMRAREEAEELSRRKIQQDNLIRKQLQKKAEQQQNSQRVIKDGMAKRLGLKQYKQQQQQEANGATSGAHLRDHKYKKQRSKSCMNQTEDIFGGIPAKKAKKVGGAQKNHAYNIGLRKVFNMQNMVLEQDQDSSIMHEEKSEVQPKQPTQNAKKKEKSTVLQIKELNKICMEEIKKEQLAGKFESFLPFSQSAFATNKRQANLVTVQQKDSKQNKSANAFPNQQSKGELNNQGNAIEEPKKRTNSKGREIPSNNVSLVSKSLHLNPAVISKVKKFLETKKKQGTKTMEQTAQIEKKLRIQNNLEMLNHKIKQHNKGGATLGLLAKRQQLPDVDTSCLSVGQVNTSGNTTSININIHNPVVPEKNLKAQIIPDKKKVSGVFNYKNELYDHSDGKLNSSSFTPEGASRRAFVPVDIDISLEMQQDCKKLLNDITKRHQLSHPDGQCNHDHHHGHHISKSNPPVLNRKIAGGANQSAQGANSFSFDVSSIGAAQVRDSSQKNDRRRGVARPLNSDKPPASSSTKKSPPSRLEEELKQRTKMQRRGDQHKNRTLHHQKASVLGGESNHPVPKSNNKDRRSNSSPNTLVADMPAENALNSIIQSNSEMNTSNYQRDQLHSANLVRGLIGSEQGSNSNNASSTLQELQSKIKILAHQYGPHIKDMIHKKKGNRQGRISKTHMLVTLHSAAIVIQQFYRKYLARKGFYMNSLTYLNTSEDDGYLDHRDQTIDDVRLEPDRVLTANISPLRTRPQKVQKGENLNVPQFYSTNSSVNDKVVQFSVISSGRPDPSLLPLSGEASHSKSLSGTATYNHLRNKTQITLPDPNSAPITQPPSGFTTALKNPKGISMIEEESKSVQDQTSPSQQNTNLAHFNDSSSKGDGAGGQSSSSRRNPVPLLNLSSLANVDKPAIHLHEERKHESTVAPKTLFERHAFQDLKESNPHLLEQFNPLQNFPEMLKIREEIITRKEESEKHLLKQQLKAEELTPRTYKSKKIELERWVTKEKEEVKKSRKRFEEEFQKTQHMINEIQRNQEAMRRLIVDQPGASTHRSRGDALNNGDHSYRVRADSQRVQSSRPGQSFLDALEIEHKGEPNSGDSSSNKVPLDEEPYKNNHSKSVPPVIHNQFAALQSESSQKSIPDIVKQADDKNQLDLRIHITDEEVKLNYILEEDEKFISNAFLNSRPTGGKIKVVDGGSSERQQENSERKNTLGDDSNFNSREGSDQDGGAAAFKKGLSRTKGSLQLPQMNAADEEANQNNAGNTMTREHMYLITTTNNLGSLGDEGGLSSDFKRNICDTSQDEVEDPGAQSPEDLKDKLKDQNFFVKDFESGNVQAVVERAQSHHSMSKRSTPSNELNNSLGDHQIRSPSQQDINEKSIKSDDGQRDRPPMPPSPSPDYHRPADFRDYQPHSLEDINIQMPTEQINLGPVSPLSNPDILVGAAGDTKIITGGGSLNSTLSVGDGGNLDLVKVIKEIKQEEIMKSTSPPAGPSSADLDEPLIPQSRVDETVALRIADDIFQNLIGELKLDLEVLLMNDPRAQKKAPSLGDSGRFPIFDRRGIQTDLFAIERYVEEVLQEVLGDKEKFMGNVMAPISKNAQEVLNQLQNSEIGSYDHFEQHYPSVLPLETYLKLERRRKDHRMQEQAEVREGGETRNFLAECEHIHNKVLFDCINDSLLQFKPYAKDGEPLPWSRQNRRLKPIEDFTIEEMFEIVKHDLFRWAIMQAGTLPRREFVFGGLFDEELFAEIREKKLATLLAREMIENEPRWLNYEFEEAQVKIDIGDMILEQLVTETINILNARMGPTALQQPAGQSENNNTSTFSSRMNL